MKLRVLAAVVAATLAQGAMAENVGTISLDLSSAAQALSSKDGWIEGDVSDDDVAAFQSISKSDSPIHMRITVVKRYEQIGCGRIQIDLSQENVPTKGFTTETVALPPVQMNLCENGDPPQDEPDVRATTEAAQAAANKEFGKASNGMTK